MILVLLDLVVAALCAAAVNAWTSRSTTNTVWPTVLAILTFIVIFLLRPITYLVTSS